MRIFFSLFIFIACTNTIAAQNFTAKYKISREIIGNQDNKVRTVATLKLDGYFYKKGNRIISFEKPLYLDEYPDGTISERENDFSYHSYSISMDSLQFIQYCDIDSMLLRRRSMMMTGLNMQGVNSKQQFEFGINNWQILPETKIINGLTCQRAILERTKGNIIADIWFATDIPLQVSVLTLLDVPGLIVECEYFGLHEKYILDSYSFDSPIADSIFWPKEFDEPFTELRKLKANNNKTSEPVKNKILREILEQ